MELTWFQALVIAVIEGLTEFLPVSSTGHMIIGESLLDVQPTPFVKAFTIVIQFGAILSVVALYFKRFFQGWDFYLKLLIAFVPAAVFGVLFSDKIDDLLENVAVVAAMLVVGGVLMLFVDRLFEKTAEDQTVTPKKALVIGLCQCVAMVPGVSRSMATIVGGMSQKLTRANAAEFSFFLAVPTMFAASAWKMLKLVSDDASRQALADNLGVLLFGNAVAFAVALLAIKFFIGFIGRHGFKAFGYYRIAVGGLLLLLLGLGFELRVL
ncbi:MAG: undecaprenyl-diphosphate phosphatase [Acidobacteriota bacterium]|nr:undecaprenyl-diphosphate phosphatase [Acidobacteriota bacterium]